MSRAKPTRDEQDRRRDYVVEWSLKGCSVAQIAAALDVSLSVVTADRAARKRQLLGHKLHAGGRTGERRLPPPPPPFDWLAPPPPKIERAYRISMMPRIKNLLVYLQESNARARLPYNIEEAAATGDAGWTPESLLLVGDAISYLQDLLKILEGDADARQQAATSVLARDDLTVAPRRSAAALEGFMPPKGGGVVPGRIYRTLMGYQWAGIPVTDEVIADIARRETAHPDRVRRAWREIVAAQPDESR